MKAIASLAWLVGCLFSAALWAQSPPAAATLEAAKKEGRLTWYTSMAVDTSRPIVDAFSAQYPFIKTELVRLGEEQLLNRILTESRAGQMRFDVVSSSGIQLLALKNFLSPYASPEARAYADELKDPRRQWTAVYNNNLVLVYNTKMLPEREAPRDYPDLLDPKWKGKIMLDSSDYDWYATLASVWGREAAMRYMERLARQAPAWRRGHGLVSQLVAAGEVPLGFAYSFRAERMKSDGAPFDWVPTFNPIVTTISGIGLGAKASAPASGRLFIDFILSKKAQEMIRDMRRVPSRGDVRPLTPKMDQSKLKLKLVPVETAASADRDAAEFRKIFGL